MENNQTPILNEEDLEKLKEKGMSEADLEILQDALNLVEVSKDVPDDVSDLLARIQEYFPDDIQKTVEMFFELPEKDPEFFKQIVSLQAFLGVVDSPIEETHVGDALRQIREADSEEERKDLTEALIRRVKGLNAESKAEFLKEMQTLETADKKELLNILNKS